MCGLKIATHLHNLYNLFILKLLIMHAGMAVTSVQKLTHTSGKIKKTNKIKCFEQNIGNHTYLSAIKE